MNQEMGGGSDVVVLDNKASKADQEQFWVALGGKGFVSAPDQDDEDVAANIALQTKLFKFMEDEGGRLDVSFLFSLAPFLLFFPFLPHVAVNHALQTKDSEDVAVDLALHTKLFKMYLSFPLFTCSFPSPFLRSLTLLPTLLSRPSSSNLEDKGG